MNEQQTKLAQKDQEIAQLQSQIKTLIQKRIGQERS